MRKATLRHCAPIFIGSFKELLEKGSASYIAGQGTITFVEYEGRCYGITNEHVSNPQLNCKIDGPVFHIALRQHVPFPNQPLFTSTADNADLPFDIAVYRLKRGLLEDGGKEPLDLQSQSTELGEGNVALAVGYPGQLRGPIQGLHLPHRALHVASTCRLQSDRTIVLQDELPEDKRDLRFGGMSGGPVYAILGEQSYALAGIAFLGKGYGDVQDGQALSDEIWVQAFPFGPDLLRRILNLADI